MGCRCGARRPGPHWHGRLDVAVGDWRATAGIEAPTNLPLVPPWALDPSADSDPAMETGDGGATPSPANGDGDGGAASPILANRGPGRGSRPRPRPGQVLVPRFAICHGACVLEPKQIRLKVEKYSRARLKREAHLMSEQEWLQDTNGHHDSHEPNDRPSSWANSQAAHLSVARHVVCGTHSTPGCRRFVELPSREQRIRSWVET